jgi:hypothetical protein
MLMAAARTVKAGVAFHCFGMYCSTCDLWHPRRPVRGGIGSEQGDGGQGSSSNAAAGKHLPVKEQPSASRHDGSSVAGSSGQPKQVDQSTGRTKLATPGLQDIEHDQLEEALDILLTLVHCLVVKGAWWQQAVSKHPLLLLQALMTVADVSPGKDEGTVCISVHMDMEVALHACPPTWLACSFSLMAAYLMPAGTV